MGFHARDDVDPSRCSSRPASVFVGCNRSGGDGEFGLESLAGWLGGQRASRTLRPSADFREAIRLTAPMAANGRSSPDMCRRTCEQDTARDGAQGSAEEAAAVLAATLVRADVLRGGSFGNQASIVRSAFRLSNLPSDRVNVLGIRPARTFPLGSLTALPPTP